MAARNRQRVFLRIASTFMQNNFTFTTTNMNIKWFGTASIAVEAENEKLLFDPFIPLAGSEHRVFEKDYSGYDRIFLTHGHIDHLSSIPEILKYTDAKVYCTKTPYHTLLKKGVRGENLVEINPGDSFGSNDFRITVYKGRHIRFDAKLVFSTVFSSRMVQHLRNIPYISKENRICRENEETVCYEIEAYGKSIFLMGSLGLDESTVYPESMDLLILPYQGSSKLPGKALAVTEKLRPHMILLDHYDDTFPPISGHIDTRDFLNAIKTKSPDIKIVGKQSAWPVEIELREQQEKRIP